ncbi:MAG TPA: glycosyltransferase [Mariniphaga sp.]|nr:glycosyltransferase [Mariniphaga sp.]
MIINQLNKTDDSYIIIPHGIDKRFFSPPRDHIQFNNYTYQKPFRIVYVSIIDVYKHQWHVVNAVTRLRKEGFPVDLTLIGPAYVPALRKLNKTLKKIDNYNEYIKYLGPRRYDDIQKYYGSSDLFVYASSCENLPNILLEGMASGLPIACSNLGPMPEILGDAGLYFNPEDTNDIANTILKFINSPKMCFKLALKAYKKAKYYNWKQCAQDTFKFIHMIAKENQC